ncbi:RagB/SusD family nutrient uptake outer membrane protein, partial [termite gut metagenome]
VTPTRIGGDWYDGGQFREFYMHSWTAQTNTLKDSWSAASSAIGTCNATIDRLENSTLLSDAEKKQAVASIRGVRAFWIYVMMDNWGNIPLVTSYQDKELPSVKPRQEVFNWLIQEVNEIANNCPEASSDTYGKFTQGAAYTLLAKLLLNAEAWKVTYSGNAYQDCVAACEKVMGMGYILEPNWKTNFSLNNNTSREAIFAICFSDQDTENQNQMMNRTLHYADNLSENANYAAWNGICAQPEYVKLFINNFQDSDNTNKNSDPRLHKTFRIGERRNITTNEMLFTGQNNPLIYSVDVKIIDGTERDGTPWGDVVQEAGARCQKWDYAPGLTNAMGNHFHIFRLADVYLMKAEALLRSGNAGEATGLVNEVRKRAYENSADYQPISTATLENVLLERRLELAWEGWSRQDDIRFGVFEKGMWPDSNCNRKTDEYLKIYPISQDAWQTNQNIVQNPGYPSF